jgi:predicted RNA-binding Zn-ribbon protein involved in translation (DUF1610 family)
MPDLTRTAGVVAVYECPDCGERLLGERRCPDCNLFARRIGSGGSCPSCGDTITIDELQEVITN